VTPAVPSPKLQGANRSPVIAGGSSSGRSRVIGVRVPHWPL
jgi:hypothetical protein